MLAPREKPPAVGRGLWMVEAAGQLICLFRDRLDYAFTPARSRGRGVLSGVHPLRILVPARSLPNQPVYESLQGRSEVGPLPTPRRYLVPPSSARQASPM
jgi:hypothetical protein